MKNLLFSCLSAATLVGVVSTLCFPVTALNETFDHAMRDNLGFDISDPPDQEGAADESSFNNDDTATDSSLNETDDSAADDESFNNDSGSNESENGATDGDNSIVR